MSVTMYATDTEEARDKIRSYCHIATLRLFVDRRRGGAADDLVLRSGGAGAADGADELAVFDQRDTAARGHNVVEGRNVGDAPLHRVLEEPRRPAEFCGRARLVFGDADRGELRAIHAREGDEIAAGIDRGDVQLPAALVGFGDGGVDRLFGFLQ